jgi:hypothetical protein
MRCLIGFFGLTRSLRHTAASISAAFYAPLRNAGIPVLSAGHFNLPARITNARSNESGVVPDRTEAGLLPLDLCWIEPQDDAAIAEELAIAGAFPDPFADEYASVANLCHQLRSLDQLWRLLTLFAPAADDLVLLLRPDLFYLDPLKPGRDLDPLLGGAADLIVPGWQNWGGLNDRFAFATARAAEAYATRRRGFVDACLAMQGIHSEGFLRFVADQAGLRVGQTALRAVRVRATGEVPANDLGMLQVMSRFRQRGPAALNDAQLTEAIRLAFPNCQAALAPEAG